MFEKLSAPTRTMIAETHVLHFESMCRSGINGHPNVNLNEAKQYLSLWRDALAACRADIPIVLWDPRWIAEFNDAIWSGDYDELVTDEERELLKRAMQVGEDADAEASSAPRA